jgi:hypothetical protein
MQTTHTLALETKHAGLDLRIAEELRRPAPDATIVARLKKQKLKIKEMMKLR